MRNVILLILIITAISSSAQQHVVTYYDVFKRFKHEDYYFDKDDKMNGKYTEYFQDGTVAVSSTYVHGKLEGKEVTYWQQGHRRGKASISNYKNGSPEGLQQEYVDPISGDFDDYVRLETFYKDGNRIWRKTYEKVEGGKICATIKETWEDHVHKKMHLLCDGSPCTAYRDVTESY